MRWTTTLSMTLISLLAMGCATQPPELRIDPNELGRIEQASVIGGKEVAASEEGGWSFRRPGSSKDANEAGAKRRSGGSRKMVARGGGGAFRGPTGEAPPPPSKPMGDPAAEPSSGTGVHRGLSEGDRLEEAGEVFEEPIIKDAKVADHDEVDADLEELEKSIEVASKSDAPFEGPTTGGAIGIGGGAGGAFGGRSGGARLKRSGRPAGPTSPGSDKGGAAAAVKTLKAGTTDDNADYDKFLEFLAEWEAKPGMETRYQPLDVSNRRHVLVVDADGEPVPGAVVTIVDADRDVVLTAARTYGDGRAPYYPNLSLAGGDSAPTNLLVEVRVGEFGSWVRWDDGSPELVLEVDDVAPVVDPVPLDVCFLIDTTGSMSDEIASIKASLLQVTAKLREQERPLDLRYGAVLYRDLGDEYITARYAFDPDVDAFDAALKSVKSGGGGDTPESLNQGLAEAVSADDWRPEAAKVVFLVADAPPHLDYEGDVWYGESLRAAVAKGVKVHSVAASGLDEVGTLIFRQIAQYTRGKFIFIEYGQKGASAAKHGVKGTVKSNNLEDILFEQIREEIDSYGRSTSL